jgi:hypothetical protein
MFDYQLGYFYHHQGYFLVNSLIRKILGIQANTDSRWPETASREPVPRSDFVQSPVCVSCADYLTGTQQTTKELGTDLVKTGNDKHGKRLRGYQRWITM